MTITGNEESAPPSEAELRDAACWFPMTDRVPKRPDITAFRQRARLHQARWREARGYAMGSHTPPGRTPVDNGSVLAEQEPMADDFRNFLDSQAIRDAVTHRVSNRERWEQLREDRLRLHLLSSMPMCFNLFGELHGDQKRLTSAGKLFGIETPGLDVKFEHSPGRRNPPYTGDGTAFDVALMFGPEQGPKHIVGIETKYHEHVAKENVPTAARLPRYEDITERSGVFQPGWRKVLGTHLQQIWRDHLLLLSMLQLDGGAAWTGGKYVLVHPAKNPAFAEAGEQYRTEFLADDRTFEVRTVESLLDSGMLLSPDSEAQFRERYLW